MDRTSKTRRAAVATGLAVITGLTAFAPSSLAAGDGFASKIRLTERFPFAHGKVKSDSMNCIAGRKIRLFEQKKGGDVVLGKTRTGSDGKWTIAQDTFSGVFYAKVNQSVDAVSGDQCLPAKSKLVVID